MTQASAALAQRTTIRRALQQTDCTTRSPPPVVRAMGGTWNRNGAVAFEAPERPHSRPHMCSVPAASMTAEEPWPHEAKHTYE